MTERAVRIERTGWRDMGLSERHRMWGWNTPAVDLDFLFLEYDQGKATAIVEYKAEVAPPIVLAHPTYQAMQDLADRAGIPLFIVRYAPDFSRWKVAAVNACASAWLPKRVEMTEREWVKFLYKLRGRIVSDETLRGLKS